MADNGNITVTEIESFIEFGASFPESSDTTLTQSDVNDICDGINAEVNLILSRLGFEMPVTAANSVEWLELTKKFGAGSLVIDGLGGQSSEEENTRADRYWNRYMERIQELLNSGGAILDDAELQTDPLPSRVPVAYSERLSRSRKRRLRFPQRAAADQYEDESAVAATRAPWTGAIGGW